MPTENQTAILDLLADAATYGDDGEVRRIDTHISHVFLVGDRAFKLKSAVKLPYLDFSSLKERYAACLSEIALNRRTAPQFYRGLRPVLAGSDGVPRLGDLVAEPTGDGETDAGGADPIDWVIEMKRFDQDAMLDRLAARGELKRKTVEALAEEIAAFHEAAEVRRDHGGRDGIAATIESNAEALARQDPRLFAPDDLERLDRRTRAALEKAGPVLNRRCEAGHVRHCHGDLHLRNIFLDGGTPVLFDAIEFSEPLACIDTLYDLAFLLMDLDHRGLRDRANAAFNRYQEIAADLSGLAALPLFLSLRAVIRAHIAGTASANADGDARENLRSEARAYLARGLSYLSPPAPRLIAVGGLSGTGKSRLARSLAPEFGAAPGALVVRTDVVRKRVAGVGTFDKLPSDAYSPEMSKEVYREVTREAAEAVAGGHAVIADAVHSKPDERAAIERVARDAGVRFTGLWLQAAPETLEQRIATRTRNASDADVDVLHRQLEYDLGEITWTRVDSSGPSKHTVARARGVINAADPAHQAHQ
jgi:aminoglycoside phosphotransferase family enzyme/predicted kinase